MILRGQFYSDTLEMDTGLVVVGPDKHTGPYRAVYLLHGLCGDSASWVDNTMLPVYAKHLDMLFVLPQVGRSFYCDQRYGQSFFTYVADELPRQMAGLFNLSTKREDTAVMGGSMGGFGAVKCALYRPERFGFCGAFAAAPLFVAEGLHDLGGRADRPAAFRERMGPQMTRDFQAMLGANLENHGDNDLPALIRAPWTGPRPAFYAACGTDDSLLTDNRRFWTMAKTGGFAVDYEELPGGHDWRFFDRALEQCIARFHAFGRD